MIPLSRQLRLGLGNKLILAILAAGSIPLVIGLSVAYIKGTSELKKVIGESFQALAIDSAASVDREMQREISSNRLLARQAAVAPDVRSALRDRYLARSGSPGETMRMEWPPPGRAEHDHEAILASWVTGPEEGGLSKKKAQSADPLEQKKLRVSGLRFDQERQRYIFSISTPIHDEEDTLRIGWLHRDYDIKKFFDPLIYPIRFGQTGHVMLTDNFGTIVSCPMLITGSRIQDSALIQRVSRNDAGWVTASSDGHGSQNFSIIGHAPLGQVQPFLVPALTWFMFVWQDSREIFAPADSLLIGVYLAGFLAIGLLAVLGYYASNRIVNPIRRLSQEAANIASGDLNQKLNIQTGDEIEELAGQFDVMRIRLRDFIGNLEEKVELRTRELKDTQAEKDRVMEQLIQTEKIAAIGTMASGIGHEINNPLYSILGLAEAIRDEKNISQCNEYGQDIIKYSMHIAEIVKNLSGYIQPAEKHDLEQVDLNNTLCEAVAMAKHQLFSDKVEIRENLMPLPMIQAKSEEIMQAFFNIIRNGIQAMGGKGMVEITSRRIENLLRIQIRDTGPGIPEEHIGNIFDPFYTTKGPDEGEGLGLYIVRQIIKKYDGSIDVESEQGVGTVFTIQFPVGGCHDTPCVSR